MAVTAIATMLGTGLVAGASVPAHAASGGASVPGSGGTDGNVRTYGWMYDYFGSGNAPVQGYDTASIDWFFANNSVGAPDTASQPNASDAMRQACGVALDRADARKGGASGTSRVVGMFWATSATPDVIWGNGLNVPFRFQALYDGWVADGRPGVLDATDNVSDLAGYYRQIDAAMAEAIAEAAGQETRAICLALNESEPPMKYTLKVTTDATNTFTIAGGTTPVMDTIHASNEGSSIVENVNAEVILHWTDDNGTTKQASKTGAIANNGDSQSPSFAPADFGWTTWAGGDYWFDVRVAKQGQMAAAVDTPDNDPRESWSAWLPDPNKDVIGSSEESGDLGGDTVNGLTVYPGQKLEYSVGVDLRVKDSVRPKITSFAVQDSFDPQFTPDKASVEFWDSRDPENPKPVARSAYKLTWDAATNSFTATFTDKWVTDNIRGNTKKGWLTLRFTGTVKDTAAPGSTVKNQAFQIVNGVRIATEVPEVKIPQVAPDKEDLNTDLIDIDGKTVLKGDHILYRLTLDAGPARDVLAYNVHKLGMVDDFDEEYLDLETTGVKVTNQTTGEDVTGKFNIQIKGGVLYVFAKQVDSVDMYGEPIPGDPQPENLKAYNEATIDPLTTPIIDQALLGSKYWITMDTTVKKVTDGYVIKNQAVQNIENTYLPTRIVSNPLKDINPDKDVVVSEQTGDDSINESEIPLNETFNYRLNSSEIPPNRAYQAKNWSITDTFDKVHDQYTGQWAVYADRGLYDGDTLLVKKGALLQDSAGHESEALKGLFTVTWDEASYTIKIDATQKYLDLVNTRGDLPQAFSVFTQMIRIAPSPKVENQTTENYNQVDRDSNIVWTSTTEHPGIDVEKFTLSEGLTKGDRDKNTDAYPIPDGELADGTRVGVRVTNTGDVPLRNVSATDQTHEGLSGTVQRITCRVGDATVPGDRIGNLAVGAHVDCEGVLTGVKAGQAHGDTVTATGESAFTGQKVTDADPWFAKAPAAPTGSLAHTGVDGTVMGWVAGGTLAAMLAGLGAVMFSRRRRKATAAE
ncbi:LPXTG cell wall anchor domain-containing protein [Agromyces sp. NPDC058126]|uniref:LPXTG cell wall anchor domain-containing protein n=1 Tax=Agromyces sp. NPDC058126 TaxID=3346350 RepID=UPI0036D92E7E